MSTVVECKFAEQTLPAGSSKVTRRAMHLARGAGFQNGMALGGPRCLYFMIAATACGSCIAPGW